MTRSANRQRRGWSLVELLCVISVLAVALGTITTFLSSTSRFSAAMRSRTQLQATTTRLASQFREDVRMSSAAAVEKGSVTLQTPSGTIAYKTTDQGPTRVVSLAGKPVARDGFWLPSGWKATWRQDNQLVTLMLRSQEFESTGARSKEIVIQANLSGDLDRKVSP